MYVFWNNGNLFVIKINGYNMKINKQKCVEKLRTLSMNDLQWLIETAQDESLKRGSYTSNTTHTPNEQCKDLQTFFGQAWIH